MDFGRLLADPIMEDTVVKQLFFSSRRYGRFSLHSGRCDACAIRLNIAFFHVFWFPTDCIPHFMAQCSDLAREWHFFDVFCFGSFFNILRKVQPYFGGPNFANLPLFFRAVKIEKGTWILVVFLLTNIV